MRPFFNCFWRLKKYRYICRDIQRLQLEYEIYPFPIGGSRGVETAAVPIGRGITRI